MGKEYPRRGGESTPPEKEYRGVILGACPLEKWDKVVKRPVDKLAVWERGAVGAWGKPHRRRVSEG